MSKHVLRYNIESGTRNPADQGGWTFTLSLPRRSQILSLQWQAAKATKSLWVLADVAEHALEERTFLVHTTGHTLPAGELRHIATLQFQGGRHVEHWFELLP
jgi:hypothetical protein